jgi:hypothetical protein
MLMKEELLFIVAYFQRRKQEIMNCRLKMYETIQGYNSKVFQEADLALFTYARC